MNKEKEEKKNLKIIIPIAIAIIFVIIIGIVLTLVNNRKISLTNDNYEQYLKVVASVYKPYESKYTVYLGIDRKNNSNIVSTAEEYKKFTMSGSVQGSSSNYIYEDVEVTIHFYGTLPLRELKKAGVYNSYYAIEEPTFEETGESVTIDKTITIKCDRAGNAILNSENTYTEESKEKNYFSGNDIDNNIKKDITVKGKVREVK